MTDINVISRSQHIIVDPASSSVSIINMGPAGPAGPPGVGGTAAGTTVVDAGNHFQPDNVEDILQVIAGDLDIRDSTIVDHETRITTNEAKILADDLRISQLELDLPTLEASVLDHDNAQAILNTAILSDISAIQTKDDAQDARVTSVESNVGDIETVQAGYRIELDDHTSQLQTSATTVSDLDARVTQLESDLAALDTFVHDHINSQTLLNTSILNDITAIQSRLDALENP